jgi:hypothetical protein
LADAHLNGIADVAVVAIMASEQQKSKTPIENFATFQSRLDGLGFGHLGVCLPMYYLNISFWGKCLWPGDPKKDKLERDLHDILFPSVEFQLSDFIRARGLAEKGQRKWQNAKRDVQALWSHINSGRDVFVSSDRNFHKPTKKPALLELGAGNIECPEVAAARLPSP